MLPLSLPSASSRRPQILCIGAHCDDIEIGCGGAILSLQRCYPGCRIHWLVLTSVPTRRREALAAANDFVKASARGEVRIGELADGLLPAHFAEVKAQFEDLKRAVEPDLILTHHGLDRHQDHALACQVTWQTFRNHLIWEYEVPKYDGDLSTPNLYVPLSAAVARRKVDAVVRAFRSQRAKTWFSAENLLATMRLRGLESRSRSGYAEAFHARKLVFDVAPGAKAPARTRGGDGGRS